MDELGTIETETHGDVTVMILIGEHDITNAEPLRKQLSALSGAGPGAGLVVSLMHTTFLDSSVVHALFGADEKLRRRDRQLVLHVATASIVRRMLDVSGLADAVTCTGSLEEAIASAGPVAGRVGE